ncbi:YbaB/EbfC family nucleoid-associated protein [Nocardia sp. NBC_01499]|uniref:YbaB/EbfC family nucleoid-associated protein n=1 Tax=Nocardia sp. NBC_01499 TaxID=2903597 RepID=UPI003869FCB9
MSEYVDVDAALAEIKTKTLKVQKALASIRGTGTAGNGTITAIVDSAGHLRDLKLSPDALRFGSRLPGMIVQATAAAEKDAAAKANAAMRPLTSDHRVEAGMQTIRETLGQAPPPSPRPMTDEEIQAADDAYFEQRNQHGWTG